MNDNSAFWRLEGPQFWGDYGDVLVAGLFDEPQRTDGKLNLTRTGPFVPPITVVQLEAVVVTAGFAEALKAAGFKLSFESVTVTKAVHLRWENWDRTANLPKVPPAGLEPENYLLRRKHSPETAATMSPLLEVVLRKGAYSESHGKSLRAMELYIDQASWNGDAVFFVHPRGSYTPVIVSDAMKLWLEVNASEWVSFRKVKWLTEYQPDASDIA